MPRYFLKIAYDGTDYSGWQIQPNNKTVQEEIAIALKRLNSDQVVDTMGCGRTDAGVHASCFYLHFDLDKIEDKNQFIFKMNCMLPSDIKVFDVIELENEAHARFDATSRTYHYFLHKDKDPFKNRFSTEFKTQLDLDLMNKACEILTRHKDFTSFSKSNTQTKTNNCLITIAKWEKLNEFDIRFTISADRFLRNMVRAIVGTMVELGTGKIDLDEFEQIIKDKDRNRAGISMPPQGLFLADIDYEYLSN
jgi:tRNA pseudouridine38-40 synthase